MSLNINDIYIARKTFLYNEFNKSSNNKFQKFLNQDFNIIDNNDIFKNQVKNYDDIKKKDLNFYNDIIQECKDVILMVSTQLYKYKTKEEDNVVVYSEKMIDVVTIFVILRNLLLYFILLQKDFIILTVGMYRSTANITFQEAEKLNAEIVRLQSEINRIEIEKTQIETEKKKGNAQNIEKIKELNQAIEKLNQKIEKIEATKIQNVKRQEEHVQKKEKELDAIKQILSELTQACNKEVKKPNSKPQQNADYIMQHIRDLHDESLKKNEELTKKNEEINMYKKALIDFGQLITSGLGLFAKTDGITVSANVVMNATTKPNI